MTEVRLCVLAELNPRVIGFNELSANDEVTFTPLEAVWPGAALDTSRKRPASMVSTGYTRFEAGDILAPKVSPTFQAGRVAVVPHLSTRFGAGSTELHVLRARPNVADARYVAYACMSAPFLQGGVAAFQGVAGLQRVPEAFVADFRLDDPGIAEQRRIADFLDEQSQSIDDLVAARTSAIRLLTERAGSLIDEAFGQLDAPVLKLGWRARIQSGVTVDVKRRSSGAIEHPYLRVANVQADGLDLREIKTISLPATEAARYLLRSGDVLMTEGGDLDKLGRGTVWNEEITNCLHQNHVFAVRPDFGLDSEYLSLLTRTTEARSYFERTGTKTTNLASTNSSKILGWRIPVPSLTVQRSLVARLTIELDRNGTLSRSMSRQIDLLTERRQALITAAVTGQLDITTARRVA